MIATLHVQVAQTPTPGSPNPTLAKLNRKGSGASSDATTEDDGVVVRRKNKGNADLRTCFLGVVCPSPFSQRC